MRPVPAPNSRIPPRPQAPQHLRALARQALAEQIRNFRCGDKIPARPDLAAAGAVVTQARRIQRQLHEALEGQPAAAAAMCSPMSPVSAAL